MIIYASLSTKVNKSKGLFCALFVKALPSSGRWVKKNTKTVSKYLQPGERFPDSLREYVSKKIRKGQNKKVQSL